MLALASQAITAQTASPSTTTARAVRAVRPPVLDGREDDDVWRTAPVIRGFRQFDPGEDLPAAFETEARVAYDDRSLYVIVRAFDPHPDSIITPLSRRDVKTVSDQLKIIIDGYLDRRNGVEMAVNPAGVKRDYAIYNDIIEDPTWDGVWDVATRIDSLGWVAEFQVPFSQLRFPAGETLRVGFGIWRDVARRNERSAWPLYRQSQRTLMAQLGTLEGMRNVPTPRRLELLPYTVSRSVPRPGTRPAGQQGEFAGGLDLKAGIGSHITVDATVRPDFGQVEADPAVLNLSAFEIRFDERRPFFQEGAGLYRCGGPCEGTFYSRRIGRTPQLRRSAADPVFTDISAAAKITGRYENGVSFGIVNATTERVQDADRQTIEPGTNTFVLRALRDLRRGQSQFGMQLVDLRRQLDPTTEPYLRRSATTLVVQGFHRFDRNRWEWSAYGGLNEVRGSANAIALTQRNSVHFFQRPDHEVAYDSTRTRMGGYSVSSSVRKIGGRVRYDGTIRYASASSEFNDAGFVNLINDISIRQQVDLRQLRPSRFLRSAFSFAAAESHWTTSGRLSAQTGQLHTSGSLHNNWSGAITLTASDVGSPVCVSCARGGAALRQSGKYGVRLDVVGDPRPAIAPRFAYRVGTGDVGRSWYRGGDAGVELRGASRFSGSILLGYDEVTNDQQWIANYGHFLSDTTHYTFARLHQHIFSLTGRANWTATPTLSLQLYAQPFVTTGDYAAWRQLGVPTANTYADRFRPWRTSVPAGFRVTQFNSNAVLRWEYRPASTLFLVWQQGRSGALAGRGTFAPTRDVWDLFAERPLNTLVLKLSYWFNP
jgi:hypothetical protein